MLKTLNSLTLSLYYFIIRAMGRHLVLDPGRICRKTRRLRGKQALICKKEPEVVTAIGEGSKLGIMECQHQFRFRRWNCTTAKRSLKKVLMRGKTTLEYYDSIVQCALMKSIPNMSRKI